MNSYELHRIFFDWCFENPEKVTPNHVAIYSFAIEHCNRLGWKEKFGFPTQMAMDAIGIKKHQTYIKYFNDLVTWDFFKLIQKSSNQYSANIISLSCGKLKKGKALGKATITHAAKQTEKPSQSTWQSNSPVDKQGTIEPDNHEQGEKPPAPEITFYRVIKHLKLSFEDYEKLKLSYTQIQIDDILDAIENYKENTNYTSLFFTAKKWLKKEYPKNSSNHINGKNIDEQF